MNALVVVVIIIIIIYLFILKVDKKTSNLKQYAETQSELD